MSFLDNLTPDEEKAIKELKKRTIDDVSEKMLEDPSLFYRFAKARNFKVKQAEAMLRKHIQWRKEVGVDNIIQDYDAPEVLKKYVPSGFLGFDKEGGVVRYLPIASTDIQGIFSAATKEDNMKLNLQNVEKDLLRNEKQSQKLGKLITNITYIYDCDKLTFSKATNKEGLEQMMAWIKLFQDNYPERIKEIYVINASTYFTVFFSIIKAVIASGVLGKIKLYGTDGWKEALLKIIDKDVLPAFLGGNKTDPDGDPLCKTFIVHGGIVPVHYYLKKSKKILHRKPGVQKLNVVRLSSEVCEFNIQEPGTILEWEFEVKNYDICFGVYFKESDATLAELITKKRFDTSIEPEKGTLRCDNSGCYCLIFDNSYSWLHSKEVYYKVTISSPGNKRKL